MARNLYRDSLVKYETIALDYQIPIWKEGSNSDGILKRITLRDFFASDVITTIIKPPNWATNNLVVVEDLTHDLNGHTVTLNGGGHTFNSSVTFRAEGPTFLPNATQDNSITKLMVLDSNGRVKFKDASSDFNKLGFINVSQSVDLDQIETDVSNNNSKVSNVSTSLSTGTRDGSNYGITSDGGADDLVLLPASTTLAGLLTAVKLGEINANTLKVGVTTSQANAIIANTAKVTNATHTGEVTGSGALTVQPTLISGKTVKSVLAGTEEILVNDGGTFKKVLASNFGGNTIFTGGTMSANSNIAMAGNNLTFDGGNFGIGLQTGISAKLHVKGAGSTSATTALLIQNSLGADLLEVKDDGTILGSLGGADGNGIYDGSGFLSGATTITSGTNHFIIDGNKAYRNQNNGLTLRDSNATALMLERGASGDYSTLEFTSLGLFLYTKQGSGSGVAENIAMHVDFSQNVGIGTKTSSLTSRLHVKGSGSTASTVAFLVENSLGTDLLEVNDVGEFFLKVQPNSNTDEVEDIFRNTLTGELEASLLKIKQETINSIDRITWKGTTGSLFSIIDDKDNELWTASDISGNPIGYIDADWNVRFGNPFNRPFSIRHNSTTGIDYTKFVLPDYANDAAADADTALLSGESYTTSAVDRTIKIKP